MTANSRNFSPGGAAGGTIIERITMWFGASDPRHLLIGGILILALFAFEMFNFDTTRYALTNLLGSVEFIGIGWASILAIAFCAIDFAGLARLFTPERGRNEPKSVWYLMGAWLLGASMNAVMTWWAVSLTLLNHNLGNEVLGREELLTFVPIFVAVLVWLTRILFIGSLTVAGEQFFDLQSTGRPASTKATWQSPPARAQVATANGSANGHGRRPAAKNRPAAPSSSRLKRPAAAMVGFASTPQSTSSAAPSQPIREQSSQPTARVRRRPPVMGNYPTTQPGEGMQAKRHD